MSYQTKRKIMNGAVYATLGLIVAAIVFIGIITFTSASKPVKPVPAPVTPTPTQTHSGSVIPNRTPAFTPTPQPTPHVTPSPSPVTTELPAGNDELDDFTLPVSGSIMKEFCIDVPVFSFTMNDYRTHAGIDISAPVGSAVCSIAKGMVADIYDDPLLGKTVTVDHGNGLISIYSNLADELAQGITKGMGVGEGQILGAVGNSALIECAESDHLHFEITLKGEHADPLTYLDFSDISDEDIPGEE